MLSKDVKIIEGRVTKDSKTKDEIILYNDIDERGRKSITIYENGKCVGTFLPGDDVVSEYEKKGGVHRGGLNNSGRKE